eukprot:scaffold156473_cov23-Prasinocladus_malaysianus.AAC.2
MMAEADPMSNKLLKIAEMTSGAKRANIPHSHKGAQTSAASHPMTDTTPPLLTLNAKASEYHVRMIIEIATIVLRFDLQVGSYAFDNYQL